jgi:2-polyprenyl-3-methyl-5-hydroxy-6-metoxy-1,4-benzoquinol methylase
VDGWDISPTAIGWAQRRAAETGAAVRFFQRDALGDADFDGYDIVVSSLFLHHLNDGQAVEFLARVRHGCRRLALISDLIRCFLGWALARVATRVLSRSAIVHTDGPRSVVRAFTRGEILQLAKRAGLEGAAVSSHWPFRFLLQWTPPHDRLE